MPAVSPAPVSPSSTDAPNRIDALLKAGQADEALALCARIAADPGRRNLARFVYQYGQCLNAAGRSRAASVMFVRCAVNHEASPYACMSLIELAVIYRDEYRNATTARRLAERALALLREDEDALRKRANAVLASLGARPKETRP